MQIARPDIFNLKFPFHSFHVCKVASETPHKKRDASRQSTSERDKENACICVCVAIIDTRLDVDGASKHLSKHTNPVEPETMPDSDSQTDNAAYEAADRQINVFRHSASLACHKYAPRRMRALRNRQEIASQNTLHASLKMMTMSIVYLR